MDGNVHLRSRLSKINLSNMPWSPSSARSTRRTFSAAREYLPALRFRSLGERVAQEVGTRRGGGHPLRGRYHLGIPTPSGRGSILGELTGTTGNVWTGVASR